MLKEQQEQERRAVKGFRLPMLEYEEERLNITDRLVVDRDNTYYMMMESNHMKGYGISEGNLLIVDRSLNPVSGAIVVAFYRGEWYTRQYIENERGKYLKADSVKVTISLEKEDEVQIWGVVTANVNPLLPVALRKGRYQHVCTC